MVLVLRNASGELEPLRTGLGDSEAGRGPALVEHRLRVYRLNEQMASNNAKLQVRVVATD
ncbi:hypothetical protein [Streptomyces chartreusis]|uniref:hypothetical protein n=1 Tax=Streptomyces chartreusis TaxID=1969 RepID=UPI00380C2794